MPPRQKSYYGSGDTVNLKEIAGSQQPPHPLSRRRASNVLITGLLGSTSAITRKEAIESKADLFFSMSLPLVSGSRCPLSSLQPLFTFWAPAPCTSVLCWFSGMLRQSSGLLRLPSGILGGASGAPRLPSDPLGCSLGPSTVTDPFLCPLASFGLEALVAYFSFAPNWCLQLSSFGFSFWPALPPFPSVRPDTPPSVRPPIARPPIARPPLLSAPLFCPSLSSVRSRPPSAPVRLDPLLPLPSGPCLSPSVHCSRR